MSDQTHQRSFWVIEYVNGRQFIGRYDQHWTLCETIGDAMLFETPGAAENARQALLQTAREYLSQHDDVSPGVEMWSKVTGGVVDVRELQQVTRLVDPRPQVAARRKSKKDPGEGSS